MKKLNIKTVRLSRILLIAATLACAPTASAWTVPAGGNVHNFLSNTANTIDLVLLGDAYWNGQAGNLTGFIPALNASITVHSDTHRTITHSVASAWFNLSGTTSNITIQDMTVIGTNPNSGYGLFSASGVTNAHLNLSGTSFSGFTGTAGYSGAIISGGSDTTKFTVNGGTDGVVFHQNSANMALDGGGAISLVAGADVDFQGNVFFQENISYSFGGALAATAAGSIINSTHDSEIWFSNNVAGVFGGALDLWGYKADVTFNGKTHWVGNYAYKFSSTIRWEDHARRGGAINIGWVDSGAALPANLTFNEVAVFKGNHVIGSNSGTTPEYKSAYGGAISAYNEGGAGVYNLVFNEAAIFEGNYAYAPHSTASGNGGAIYYHANSASLVLAPGTSFTNNYASTYGGAIYLRAGTITLKSSPAGDIIFKGNRHGVTFTGADHDFVGDANSGTPNAVYLGAEGVFNIITEGASKVEFYDPIQAAGNVAFNKLGPGSVIFYDYSSLAGMTVGSPTTAVKGGFFVLRLSDPSQGGQVTYGTLGRGTVTVSGSSASEIGVIVGESSAILQADIINVNAHGEIWGDDPTGAFKIKAKYFNLNNNGGIGGRGRLRVENDTSTTPINITTSGTFIIDAVNHSDMTDPSAVFELEGSKLQGTGKLKKTGPGTFIVDKNNTYSGGTQIDNGTLRLTYTDSFRQTSKGIGAGAVVVNEKGVLKILPDSAGNYSINNALSAHNTGATGGLIDVDLLDTNSILTFTNATAFDGRIRMHNLTHTLVTNSGGSGCLTNAYVEVAAGTLVHVNTGISDTGGFKFDGGIVRFNDITLSNGTIPVNGRVRTSVLDVSGTGSVQINAGVDNSALFADNNTSLLLRDDFGLSHQLIGAKGASITVIGDASGLTLTDFNKNLISAEGTSSLIQSGQEVATQYLRVDANSLTTGYKKDGLYLGALLYRLDLNAGKTTIFSGDDSNYEGGDDFKAQITGAGNLQINATQNIILKNGTNTYTGNTIIDTGRLTGGADNVTASSANFEVRTSATFDTGNYNQTTRNLTGAGTVEVNAAGAKKLTVDSTVSTTFSGAFTGAGNIEKTGNEVFTISGSSHTHTGDWSIAGGTLLVTGALGNSASYGGNMTMSNNSSLIFNQSGYQILNGNISRADSTTTSIEKKGAGTLVVNGVIAPHFTLSQGTLAGTGTVQNAILSPGTTLSPGNTQIGTLSFGETAATTTVFSNLTFLVDLSGASISDKIAVTGAAVFANNNTVNFQWDDAVFKDGSYTILAADSGKLFAADGVTPLTSELLGATLFRHGGDLLANPRYSAELRFVTADGQDKIVLTTWANKNLTVYWGGSPAGSDDWNLTKENWWATESNAPNGKFYLHFSDGDIALFNEEAPAKIVSVDSGGSVVYAMIVSNATYEFNGGKITGDPDSWNKSNNGLPSPPTGTSPNLLIESNASATFNNEIAFPNIVVEGAAVFNNKVSVSAGGVLTVSGTSGIVRLGNTGSFDNVSKIEVKNNGNLIEFNRTSNDYTFAGVISGAGSVLKTGSAEVEFSGKNTYTGNTVISGGKLLVTGSLGGGNYGGTIANAATVEFRQTEDQEISGIVEGAGNFIKSGAGTLTLSNAENRYTGDTNVNAGRLNVTGRLGAKYHKIDEGTPWEKNWVQGYYEGKIHVENAGTISFGFTGDFQVLAGALTGAGTLEKTGPMPLHFIGDASTFYGTTKVRGGSFHLTTPNKIYGADGGAAGAFEVSAGATLFVGSNSVLRASSFNMNASSQLVVATGKYKIEVSLPENVTLAKNVEMYLGKDDLGGTGAAKLSLPDGVVPDSLKVTQLRFRPMGYFPQPPDSNGIYGGVFKLMDGFASASVAGLDKDAGLELAHLVFGADEYEILGSRFQLFFQNDGSLMLEQISWTNIPEPETYGLFSCGLLAGAVFIRNRQRKKKSPPEAATVKE
ncbi:MAG: autotransporter-associated beta strand repeat-containing protein [Puniceicoccales bacterium]|jgi:autotransporter-associated beta strand protein/predicted outer membrane repeat protein|nr:autotransporter-associated beta strand repeat-containing protein [Puniceicoccales bacterium]